MNKNALRKPDDLLKLRTSYFMGVVKNAANNWAQSNAQSLLSLEDRLKLVASGEYTAPVNVYIQVGSTVSHTDMGLLRAYQAAVCECYNRLQKEFDVIPDSTPIHSKMPILPEYAALMKVRELIGEWVKLYRALDQFRYLIQVLPLDSGKQIDIFMPYETILPEESRRHFSDLRIRSQRVYAKILRRQGISVELPVVSITAATSKPYTGLLGGSSNIIH